MFENTQFVASPTGAMLAVHTEPAQGSPRGIVLIAHGMSEHSRRYARFAAHLAARDYHVHAWDHRGHGETTAPDAVQGQFARREGLDKVIDDTLGVRNMAAAATPDLPILLFGHSMGAMIAVNAALKAADRFAGFAAWNFDFSGASSVWLMRLLLRSERWLKGSDVPSALLPRLTFEAWGKKVKDHRTPFDWLSNIPAEVDAYIADPACGFDCTVSLWLDIAEGMSRSASRSSFARVPPATPFMLAAGGMDPATRGGKGIEWFETRLRALGFSNVLRRTYPEARHETLNDVVAERAMDDFAAWADSICPAR